MSSSMFVESSSSIPKTSTQTDDMEYPPVASTTESNLVVVYSKNGVNFDRKGLENLIEEKTISSISVIRLTSPTPSMENEEEEVAKLEELLRRQDIDTDEDPETNSDKETETEDDGRKKKSTSDEEVESSVDASSENASESTDAEKSSGTASGSKKKKRKTRSSNPKVQKVRRKPKKERPDIVGLTVEQFYPPKDAKELAKEILRMAGLPTVKHTADHEIQMHVIRNDHCYTPFTSPSQMKAKLAADKLEAERQQTAGRKTLPQSSVSTPKQLFAKKRPQPLQSPAEDENKKPTTSTKIKIQKERQQNAINSNELVEDDEEMNTSNAEDVEEDQDEDTDLSASETSAETDNDRDSDLDFNLNNRKGRKRRVKKKSKRLHSASKMQNRRRLQSQDDSNDAKTPPPLNIQRPKLFGNISSDPVRMNKTLHSPAVKVMGTTAPTTGLSKPLSQAIAALPPIPKKITPPGESKIPNSSIKQTIIANTVRRGPIVQVRPPIVIRKEQLQSPSQTVKEIVINKVMASPKGGFTDISALLTKSDKSIIGTPTTPTSSMRTLSHSTPISKGFTRLGVESAAKNQLPAQISIQTHQSTSELAAEHDKQLDLIDSIVQDELQKLGIMEQPASVNENIPELVKMLESTEKALESKHKATNQTNNLTNIVENVDIANANLLDTTEDEIPDDLLQHVVDLIEEDKTLQEAVEKQVFGVTNDSLSFNTSNTSTPAVTPIKQPPQQPSANSFQEFSNVTETPSKSIIHLTLPNASFSPQSSINDSRLLDDQTLKITPNASKLNAPIKVVRGNGRVITLPPIEAPTTRAKKRAQVYPTQYGSNASSFLNDSSLDSSMQSNASFTYVDASFTEKKSSDADVQLGSVKETSVTPSTGNRKSTKKQAVAKRTALTKPKSSANVDNNETDEDAESREDDDDPNKLWCICRQPHNNRFMICCDLCEDWFHGTCVSITKAMGLEMEQKGIDWTCPKCVKKQEEKKQRKITDMMVVKKANLTAATQLSSKETVDAPLTLQSNVTVEKSHSKPLIQKKIQTGRFVTLKDLENNTNSRKFPITVIGSDQKKLYAALPNAKVPTLIGSTVLQGKRVIVQKINEVQKPKTATATASATVTLNKSKQTQLQIKPVIATPLNPCIVCKKAARENTIYCSDDCIRKYANNYLAKPSDTKPITVPTKLSPEDSKKKAKGLFEDLLLMADRKPKAERVNVYERKSGRILLGSNAPTTLNLKKWLQDNPTYEVVPAGSGMALEIEKRQKQRALNSSLPNITFSQIVTNPAVISPQANLSPTVSTTTSKLAMSTVTSKNEESNQMPDVQQMPKPVKQLVEHAKQTIGAVRPQTPKQQLHKKQTKPEVKEDSKSKDKVVKLNSNENVKKRPGESGIDPVRKNVRRTLKEQLLQRIAEQKSSTDLNKSDETAQLNADEVEKFAKETEVEMFNYFNRDVSAKYKAKYRSLMFNIKDRKNHTLFAKICAKLVEPKQLVRMSPEELASQELAQWREKEAKHQLEMIKKSELDLLSCAKNYVLKTHKGEEVIEGKSIDCFNLDITTPVEDVVSVLNNATALTSEKSVDTPAVPRKEHLIDTYSSTKSLDETTKLEKQKSERSSKEKEKIRRQSTDRDRRHKKKDHHREKTRSRKRSRSHSRSRSRSKEKKHKTYHKDERRDKEERNREKDKESKIVRDKEVLKEKESKSVRDKEVLKEKESKEDSSKKILQRKTLTTTVKDTQRNESSSNVTRKPLASKPMEPFSLIDQILESSKTIEQAANLVPEAQSEKEMNKPQTATKSNLPSQSQQRTVVTPDSTSASISTIRQEFSDSDSDTKRNDDAALSPDPYFKYYDANSVLSQSTLWEGNINMIDVTSLQMHMQSVVGNTVNLGKLMDSELEVVGRIVPEIVLDYVSKIKRSPNKEIVIVRLVPANNSETAAYTILYDYLDQRKRMGVIKTTSSQIKDFYIFPLSAKKLMPTVLQPLERVSFYEDSSRPNVLLGIVIRVIGKRTSMAPISLQSTSMVTSTTQFSRRANDMASFTPPGSPKRSKRDPKRSIKEEMEIDAIIKGPMTAKMNKTDFKEIDDADEPYSPGGSSDDDVPSVPFKPGAIPEKINTSEDELKRKMDEINRQIAAQEMEIAGLLNVDSSCYGSTHSSTSKVLANISIPSNLSQILASIKSKPAETPAQHSSQTVTSTNADGFDEEYNPEDAFRSSSYDTGSKLKHLSEAELLSMVPDDMIQQLPTTADKLSRCDEQPPPPGV